MMSFEEFAENVVKEIRAKVGGAFQIKEHNVIKNNNVKRAGIAVMKNEEDIGHVYIWMHFTGSMNLMG